MSYTKIEYTSPVITLPPSEGDESTFIGTIASKQILWSCDTCSALVHDQGVHDDWHFQQGTPMVVDGP